MPWASRALIEQQAVLQEAFANPLQLQGEIDGRMQAIRELEAKKSGLLGNLKSSSQIVYLKSLNQKDEWSKKKS